MKKTGLLTALLITAYSFTFSQNLRIGLNADFSSKSMDIADNIINQDLKGSLTYGLTAKIGYVINEKFNIQTGIGYELNTFKLKYNFRFADAGDPLMPKESTSTLSYLNIPVQIGYNIPLSDKLTITPSFGMNFGFLIKNSEETTFEAGNTSETNLVFSDLNNTIYSLTFDLPFNYEISDKTSLVFTPFVAKALNKVDEVHSENTFFQYGGRVGVKIKI